jgi:hypothetical protein
MSVTCFFWLYCIAYLQLRVRPDCSTRGEHDIVGFDVWGDEVGEGSYRCLDSGILLGLGSRMKYLLIPAIPGGLRAVAAAKVGTGSHRKGHTGNVHMLDGRKIFGQEGEWRLQSFAKFWKFKNVNKHTSPTVPTRNYWKLFVPTRNYLKIIRSHPRIILSHQ